MIIITDHGDMFLQNCINQIIKHKSIENLLDNGLMGSWSCNYEKIRQIICLTDIDIDSTTILNQYSKKPNLTLLKLFLKENSTIDEKTYLHRINLIIFSKIGNLMLPVYLEILNFHIVCIQNIIVIHPETS